MGRLKAFDEDKVLDRAVDCFWQHGYEATSVRDLADRMGIGGASLYNAYGDKRALFITALARYADRSMRERIDHPMQITSFSTSDKSSNPAQLP